MAHSRKADLGTQRILPSFPEDKLRFIPFKVKRWNKNSSRKRVKGRFHSNTTRRGSGRSATFRFKQIAHESKRGLPNPCSCDFKYESNKSADRFPERMLQLAVYFHHLTFDYNLTLLYQCCAVPYSIPTHRAPPTLPAAQS